MRSKNKWKQAMMVTRSIFRQESFSYRAVMGYLLGIAIVVHEIYVFFKYVNDTGDVINILETFLVIEQHLFHMLFLVLGWFLVIADAPFIQSNTYLLLYRTSRRRWNMGMLMYLVLQAFLYVLCMAMVTILAGSFRGFWSSIWSSPVYMLAMDYGNDLGVKYQITFPWTAMMKYMTVPEAFCITFLFLFCYLAFLGVLLYVCNLLLRGVWGVIIVLGVHCIGYLLLQDGWTEHSLFARAIPGYFIDGTNRYWSSPCIFLLLIAALSCLSFWIVRKVDFGSNS